MQRSAMAITVLILSPLLGGAISAGRAAPELEALGWRKAQWHGIRPAEFSATPGGGVRIRGQGQGSFLWRVAQAPATCLAWRWRVDAGPPATDLTRRGGDDRAVAVAVGFSGFGPQAGFAARAQHTMAQGLAGDHVLPRSVLVYVWGGTGQEAAPGAFFLSPWTGGVSRKRVLRAADAPRGQWVEERVNLGADWRLAFGGGQVPTLQELVISTDADDTNSVVDAQVENLRLLPCI